MILGNILVLFLRQFVRIEFVMELSLLLPKFTWCSGYLSGMNWVAFVAFIGDYCHCILRSNDACEYLSQKLYKLLWPSITFFTILYLYPSTKQGWWIWAITKILYHNSEGYKGLNLEDQILIDNSSFFRIEGTIHSYLY